MPCIFCKIANKELPSEIIYEDEKFLAFKDVNPVAPFHFLIVPKKHIPTLDHIELHDKELIGELFLAAKEITQKIGLSESGYRLVFNIGKDAGQTVNHLHLHLLGGKKLTWP